MSDPLIEPLENFAKRTSEGIGKKAVKAVKDVVQKMEHGTKEVASNAVKTEEKHAGELSALGRARGDMEKDFGSTPVYRLNDDGTVDRLTPHGPRPLTDEERKKLPLNLDGDDKVPERPTGDSNPYKLPEVKKGESRDSVPSTKIPTGGSDLARATQLARHEEGDYGTLKGSKFTSKNYAAVRHGEAGDPDSFILVGRSKYPTHSERVLGVPFLQSGTHDGLTELYTERAPCSNSVNCGAWMDHFLPDHVKVSHSVDYGATAPERAKGNAGMKTYLDKLKL